MNILSKFYDGKSVTNVGYGTDVIWVEEFFVLAKEDKSKDKYSHHLEDIRLLKRKKEAATFYFQVVLIPMVLEELSKDVFQKKKEEFLSLSMASHCTFDTEDLNMALEFINCIVEIYQEKRMVF